MRLRILAVGLFAVAALTPSSSADPTRFERPCEGKVDALCTHSFCGIVDCIVSDCVVFVDPAPGYNTGFCGGKPRPRDPAS